jgi:hypothetical protein
VALTESVLKMMFMNKLKQGECAMSCRTFVPTIVACCLATRAANADGLIFQLPPDGTWARFIVQTEGKFGAVATPLKGGLKMPELPEQKVAFTSTFTISCVGAVERNQQKCRWIELKAETKAEKIHPLLLLKMLIPEEYLKRGEDPLSHSVVTFFNPKELDKAPLVESFIDEGFNRIQYEIERFRPNFPKPLENPKIVKGETVKTEAGVFENCEVISGTESFDGALIGDGRWVYKHNYRIVVHPQAPFGVVALESEGEGREIRNNFIGYVTGKTKLQLTQTGKGAVSDLPGKGKEKANH